jgi:hypothetical protein
VHNCKFVPEEEEKKKGKGGTECEEIDGQK